MKSSALSVSRVVDALSSESRPVVDLVDELLPAFQTQAMLLEWEDGQCRLACLPLVESDVRSVPLPRTVFRAILARLAVLCNGFRPDSVSPYGGEGEFVWQSQRFQVSFSNNNQQGCFVEIGPAES